MAYYKHELRYVRVRPLNRYKTTKNTYLFVWSLESLRTKTLHCSREKYWQEEKCIVELKSLSEEMGSSFGFQPFTPMNLASRIIPRLSSIHCIWDLFFTLRMISSLWSAIVGYTAEEMRPRKNALIGQACHRDKLDAWVCQSTWTRALVHSYTLPARSI